MTLLDAFSSSLNDITRIGNVRNDGALAGHRNRLSCIPERIKAAFLESVDDGLLAATSMIVRWTNLHLERLIPRRQLDQIEEFVVDVLLGNALLCQLVLAASIIPDVPQT